MSYLMADKQLLSIPFKIKLESDSFNRKEIVDKLFEEINRKIEKIFDQAKSLFLKINISNETIDSLKKDLSNEINKLNGDFKRNINSIVKMSGSVLFSLALGISSFAILIFSSSSFALPIAIGLLIGSYALNLWAIKLLRDIKGDFSSTQENFKEALKPVAEWLDDAKKEERTPGEDKALSKIEDLLRRNFLIS